MGKVWIIFAVAVSLVTFVDSKNVSGVDKDLTSEWPKSIGERRAALIRSSNRSEFSGKWKNLLQENGSHTKTSSKIGSKFPLLVEGTKDVYKKMLQVRRKATQELFNGPIILKMREKSGSSLFITRMAKGTLPLELFNEYLAKDAFFLSKGTKLYEQGANFVKEKDANTYSFFEEQALKYGEHRKSIINEMNIREITQNEAGVALQKYSDFLDSVTIGYEGPMDILMAMLPCAMLYSELANTVPVANPQTNPYYKAWFEKNKRIGEGSTEIIVNSHLVIENPKMERFRLIFSNAMLHELNFLRESSGESIYKSLEEFKKMEKI